MSPLLADIVAKVENRATRKISRKLVFGLLCRCVAFQRHYGGSWSILDETIWSLTSPLVKRISGSRKFRSSPQKDFCNNIGTFRTSLDVRDESVMQQQSGRWLAANRLCPAALKPEQRAAFVARAGQSSSLPENVNRKCSLHAGTLPRTCFFSDELRHQARRNSCIRTVLFRNSRI